MRHGKRDLIGAGGVEEGHVVALLLLQPHGILFEILDEAEEEELLGLVQAPEDYRAVLPAPTRLVVSPVRPKEGNAATKKACWMQKRPGRRRRAWW